MTSCVFNLNKGEAVMHVSSVKLIREGAYGYDHEKIDPTKPFVCTVEIVGQTGKHTLRIGPEVSQAVMGLIAEELAAEGRRVADMMQAQAFDHDDLLIIQNARKADDHVTA